MYSDGRRFLGSWFVFALAFATAWANFNAPPASLLPGARASETIQDDVRDEVATSVGGLASPRLRPRRGSIRSAWRDAALRRFSPQSSRLMLSHMAGVGSLPRLSVRICRFNC